MKKKLKNQTKYQKLLKEILIFNRENREQQGSGLKILTPNQIPISLAQLKAGNNFEKLKKEIRQILYFLHR